jgi:hypothetical protein
MFEEPWYRKPTKEIKIYQEVYSIVAECAVNVKNIRVDTSGTPIFDLEDCFGAYYVARFSEIMEII